MFKVDAFKIVSRMDFNPREFVKTIRYWDKAGSEGTGAYTVGVRMSLLTGNRWLVEDVRRGRWGSSEREKVIRRTAEDDGTAVEIWIEQEPGSGGKESAEGTIRNLAGYVCRAERPTGDKVFRADPYSVQVNNKSVMMLAGDWNYDYIEEHRFFPYSTYKDQVDASSGAFNKLIAKKIARCLI
jgi:predicted phage terminase large subunit-like protein